MGFGFALGFRVIFLGWMRLQLSVLGRNEPEALKLSAHCNGHGPNKSTQSSHTPRIPAFDHDAGPQQPAAGASQTSLRHEFRNDLRHHSSRTLCQPCPRAPAIGSEEREPSQTLLATCQLHLEECDSLSKSPCMSLTQWQCQCKRT